MSDVATEIQRKHERQTTKQGRKQAMTDEQIHKAFVNIRLEGELLEKVEMVERAWKWSRTRSAEEIMRKGANLPTPLDMAPDERLDGEGN